MRVDEVLLPPAFIGLGIWWLLTQASFHWLGWALLGVVPLMTASSALRRYSERQDGRG